jgi:hypothetical protein
VVRLVRNRRDVGADRNGQLRAQRQAQILRLASVWHELRMRAARIGAATTLVWLGVPLLCGLWPIRSPSGKFVLPTLAVAAIWLGVLGALCCAIRRHTPPRPIRRRS